MVPSRASVLMAAALLPLLLQCSVAVTEASCSDVVPMKRRREATQDTGRWPLVDPLPSYGRGRELPGRRYMSFIQGDGISDVIITGENGTIDGQGEVWWNMWRRRSLRFTRPNLLEFKNSRDIIISNVVFQNSPFWNIHPVYCSNVVIKYVTVLAPHDSPNTDGIDPDSSSNLWGVAKRSAPWKCVDVSGAALGVQPWPCSPLARTISSGYCSTAF
ncbi:hypothetical protein OPV22_013382 [Ensete ventricosum]|uniref:Pectate lyase superfamily protein domain-containing protein n=1 Tax=Ensete ventricosum TaxID=4639 RepID=A0AAV8R3Q5_ENSVE|nr:hypothetical protein OPV22_013382 [Ensete ventricosum]